MIIKWISSNRLGGRGVDSPDSRQVKAAVSSRHAIEFSCCIKCRKFIELLMRNQFLAKDVAPHIKSVKVNKMSEFECVNHQVCEVRIMQILMWQSGRAITSCGAIKAGVSNLTVQHIYRQQQASHYSQYGTPVSTNC